MSSLIGWVDPTEAHATQKFPLGLRVEELGVTYEYYRAGAAVTAKNALICDSAEGPNDLHHSSAVEQVLRGIAMATLADNEFGWAAVKGKVTGVNVGTPSAQDPLGTTATAGRLDTKSVGAAFVQNEMQDVHATAAGVSAYAVTAAAANTATVFLN